MLAALHLACVHGAAVEVVAALLDRYPAAAMRPAGAVGLPLHAAVEVACQPGAGSDRLAVVELLLAAAPESAKAARHHDSCLPLHVAARFLDSTALDEVVTAAEGDGGVDDDSPDDGTVGQCRLVARALVKAHPLTSDWPLADLVRARSLGEGVLLDTLAVERRAADDGGADPLSDSDGLKSLHEAVLLSLGCGAPDHVMGAIIAAGSRDGASSRAEPQLDHSPRITAAEEIPRAQRPGMSPRTEERRVAWGKGPSGGLWALAARNSPRVLAASGSSREAEMLAQAPAEATMPRYQSALSGGNAKMGVGGSYVLPATRLADEIITGSKAPGPGGAATCGRANRHLFC